MRHSYLLLLLLVAVCCGPKKQTTAVKPDLVYPEQGLFSTDFKHVFFGKLGYRDRSFQEDTLLFPSINGLVHGSVYAMCPTDTCFAEYAVLALRCPPIQPLLDWVADTVKTFARECPIGDGLLTYNEKQLDIPVKHLKSDKAICDYYIGQLQHAYDGWHCTGEGDPDNINEQAGLLLADCWHTGNLYTFWRIDWYDWLSGGNNARESWWTVDATSGQLLGLSDFILPEKKDTLAALMMRRLVNGRNEFILDQYPFEPEDYASVLECANGCALLPEGMVFFFYPYNLGSGADGEYEAMIPYEELDGILKEPLSMVLVPSQDNAASTSDNPSRGQKPSIDLFGTELSGSPKHILQEINKGGFIQIDLGPNGFLNVLDERFSCRVFIDEIPFAMNVSYVQDEETNLVKDVLFITSNSDDSVMVILLKKLTEYYGKPAIDDGDDGGYTWFPNGRFMKARHLHTLDEGGWTFYIN